jgi:hypothetical protein
MMNWVGWFSPPDNTANAFSAPSALRCDARPVPLSAVQVLLREESLCVSSERRKLHEMEHYGP